MKTIYLLITTLCIAVTQAGFQIPKGVYQVTELESARAKAASENLPLVYVLSNTTTT